MPVYSRSAKPGDASVRHLKNICPTDNALLWNRVCSIALCRKALAVNQMNVVLRGIGRRLRAFLLRGSRFHCPLCAANYRRFRPAGDPPRENAVCPGCASLERHRLLWMALEKQWRKGVLRVGDRMLHIAPELVLAKKFEQRFGDYVSIDLDDGRAMEAMDVTALTFGDEYFDAIVCNHVLEHVPDDRTAISELYRVLKPGGWGSIQVPMRGEVTHEDPSVTDAEERRRLYGQDDHVRQYGSDFINRLRDAGFEVLILSKQELLDPDMLERLSVACEDEVVLVTRPLRS